jgi:molecular chaperone DnaK
MDLGTSTSEVAVYRNDRYEALLDPRTQSAIVPSLVAVSAAGELLVGQEALSRVDQPGFGVREVKRLMGTDATVSLRGETYRPEEVSALILRKLKHVAEVSLGESVSDVVITVPANFPDQAKAATHNAAQIAGLNALRLINEPTAAAMAFGVKNLDQEEQLVVFDFGGGTLDVTTLEMVSGIMDVKSSFGDTKLGGKDFDDRMIDLILRKFHATGARTDHLSDVRRELKAFAEAAKKDLSTRREAEISVARFGQKGGEMVNLEVRITREEYEDEIGSLLDRARTVLKTALQSGKLRPSSIGRILLVGGTTYIPAVRDLVSEAFGKPGSTEIHPDLAVAYGASVQAAIIQDLISSETGLIVADIAPIGIGIDIMSDVGGQKMLMYEPLLLPNQKIPVMVERDYSLMHADQRELEIEILQDPTGKAKLATDAVKTDIIGRITDIPPNQSGNPHPLKVAFSYDLNGMIRLRAWIPGLDKSLDIGVAATASRMSDEQKVQATDRIDEIWKSSPYSRQFESLIRKGERLVGEKGDEAKPISEALIELKSALADGNESRIETAGGMLADAIFDLEG